VSKYRIYPLFLLITAMALFFNSCAGSSGIPASPEKSAQDKPVTVLRFISSWGGVDSKAKTLKEILSQFVADNPDIVVENESLFGEDFLPKIKTDFASGNNPDVFGLWPGSDINTLVRAGKVADLTEILNADPEWKQSFDDGMWAYTTYDGRIYGLPVEVIFECLFINKDLFTQYHVPIPQTYDQLKDAVEVFRRHYIIPIAFNTYAEGTYLYQSIIALLGGKEDVENPFKDGRVKKCYIDALKYVKELYDLGAFPQEYFTITNNERNMLFKDKKAAMIVQGSWFIGDFPADNQTVDILPFPYIEGGKSPRNTVVYGLGGGSFHMSESATEDSLKREASIKLLRALTSSQTAAIFAADTGMISNVNIDKYNIEYRRMTLKGRKMLADARLLVGPPDSYVDRSSWEEDIVLQLPYFLEGKLTAEQVWANAISKGIIPNW
jgi:raffinose/stachyose/melibiose transport system substrate-binding protein